MESRKEKPGWMSVPQFGGWDQKSAAPDYSMVFSRARANRKQVKTDVKCASIGTEKELIPRYQPHEDQSGAKKKKLSRYLSCCSYID